MTPFPLSEFPAGSTYRGETGGLYGEGCNTPPPALLERARSAAARIRPLAPDGGRAADGAIGLLALGFSNAEDQFAGFARLAEAQSEHSPALRFVNGAQAHMGSQAWASGMSDRGDPWLALATRLKEAATTARQVQVVWLKLATRFPAQYGEFPRHVAQTTADLAAVVDRLGREFPNLRLVYCSSRVYAGYAEMGLNPEPYAYEEAFAVRALILGQPAMARSSDTPIVVWGPYLWANGKEARGSDGLCWLREDFTADGTHPSPAGAEKVGRLLLDFFRSEPTSTPWFLPSS